MTAFFKPQRGADGAGLRSLRDALSSGASVQAAALPQIDPELAVLRTECERLRKQLADSEKLSASLKGQIEAAFEKGHMRGREEGLKAAVVEGDRALTRLQSGIDRALAAFEQAMAGLETLAPALAREGVAAILGPDSDRAGLAASMIIYQVGKIDAEAIVHIDVSAADFSDVAALRPLADALGARAAKLRVDNTLGAGDCRIRLTLGTVEIGLRPQWDRLDNLLASLSRGDGGHG